MTKATVVGLAAGIAVSVVAGLGWVVFGVGGVAAPIARPSLNGFCAAFVDAEKRFPHDPVAAYDWVKEQHTILWPDLRKAAAGISGIYPGGRYPMMLRFARNDYALADWECPAMDRVFLGVTERRPMPETDGLKPPHISVYRDGQVMVDGQPIETKDVERVLVDLKERGRVAELYRQDWQTQPHPAGKRVLDVMVKLHFIIDLQPRAPGPRRRGTDDE